MLLFCNNIASYCLQTVTRLFVIEKLKLIVALLTQLCAL